jgi:type II secretory pathway component PulF
VNTPRSLNHWADFYRQLGQCLAAGLPVIQSLETIYRNPPAARLRPFIECLLANTRAGNSLAEGFRSGRRWTNRLDTTLIDASERSGKLDRCLGRLAEGYAEQAGQLRRMLTALVYPAFIVHFAALLAPLPTAVTSGEVGLYALRVLLLLAPLYGVAAVLTWVFLGRHGETWHLIADQLLTMMPFLGGARRSLALARLAETLDVLLAAGVGVLEAWPMAAAASGSASLRRRVDGWAPLLAEGETPGTLLSQSREFPHLFASHYLTGERSGSLDQSLTQLRTIYLEEGNQRMRTILRILPFGFYMLVMVAIAIYIIRFWLNYYGGIFRELGI